MIVINGGINDTDNSNKKSGVLVKMTQFVQRYNNTSIIVVNIPHRYDLDKDSMVNSEIQAHNSGLNKIAKLYRHVAIVKCDSNRKYFTRHGLHLNNNGKEGLSKQIATQIDKLIKDNNRDESKIILKLKDESTK